MTTRKFCLTNWNIDWSSHLEAFAIKGELLCDGGCRWWLELWRHPCSLWQDARPVIGLCNELPRSWSHHFMWWRRNIETNWMGVSSNKTSTDTPSCNDSSNIQETDAFGSHKELYGSQTFPVALIGNALVSLKEDLGSQMRNHGNTIAVTLVKVSPTSSTRAWRRWISQPV